MVQNYIKVIMRNILRHKGYALINLLGLAIGMACCILILLYIQDEFKYDQYPERHDRIYRMVTTYSTADRGERETAKSAVAWGWMLTDAFPDVEGFTRIKSPLVSWLVGYPADRKQFHEPGFYFADPGMLDLFDYKLVRGDAATALNEPNTVVMTETMARKYFGNDEPLGKVLRLDNNFNLTVTGIMEDVPQHSHMTFGFLGSFETLNANAIYGGLNYANQTQNPFPDVYTYLLLAEGTDPEGFEQKLAGFIDQNYGEVLAQNNTQISAALQPLTSIHLQSNLDAEISPNSDMAYIYIFMAVALFILLIACINFMNLATARSANRAREVGIRKVLGAFRVQLIYQFIGESTTMALLSLILGIILVYLLLPVFNALAGKTLFFSFGDMSMVFGLIGIVFLVGLLAGSYPALFLSSFRPVAVLKGSSKAGSLNTTLRKALVIFQFVISVVFIIGTGVVSNQMTFVQNKHLGFNKAQVVVIPMGDPNIRITYSTYKEQISGHPGVLGATAVNEVPGGPVDDIPFLPEGNENNEPVRINNMWIDHDFIRTFGIEMKLGRDFSTAFPTDTLQAFVLNEAAVTWLGWEGAPLDKEIKIGNNFKQGRVIGVVKDFHVRSLHSEIEPMMMQLVPNPDPLHYIAVRIAPENVSGTIEFLRSSWQEVYPQDTFAFSFLDEDFNSQYQTEERRGQIFRSFSMLAVFIACLGLLGLASFTAEQRTKEIGVRKVLGASVGSIMIMLSKEFIKLVLLASLLAWPIAYLVMNSWLDNFAYHVDLSPWLFLLSAVLAVVITLVTVGYQAIKAALTNPVTALQYE